VKSGEANGGAMRATSILVALAATLALAGVAAASGPSCPDCHPDHPPIKNDCGYSSAHEGVQGNDSSEAGRGAVCVANAHHKQGPWIKLEACFASFVNKVGHKLGLNVNLAVYASQDGVDVDSHDTVAGRTVDYDRTPIVGKTDDATWTTLHDVHAVVDGKLPVDTRDAPEGGDDLPHVTKDVCAKAPTQVGC
jgi:hypothetical protein